MRWFKHLLVVLVLSALAGTAWAHGVAQKDVGLLTQGSGIRIATFMYLGAKHMVTGYDHLLFLCGVIWFLHRLREVALYVTLFALGHSLTLLLGVLGGIHASAYLVDAVIGLSVVYKAFDNLGGLRALRLSFDPRAAVFLFGLVHGFGLSTKLQELALSPDGLVPNMLAFNAGVELGQLAALVPLLLVFELWRRTRHFLPVSVAANGLLMVAGFTLIGAHLAGYFLA